MIGSSCWSPPHPQKQINDTSEPQISVCLHPSSVQETSHLLWNIFTLFPLSRKSFFPDWKLSMWMQHGGLLKQVFYFKLLLDCGDQVLLQVRALFLWLLELIRDQVQDGAEGFLSDRRVSLHQPPVVRNTLSLINNFIHVFLHPLLCIKYFDTFYDCNSSEM